MFKRNRCGADGSSYELRCPGLRSSQILFGSLSNSDLWADAADSRALISDATVLRLHGDSLTSALARGGHKLVTVTIPEGEPGKSLETLERVYEQLHAAELDRNSSIVALGGGSVCDLTGFAAATYLRGVKLISLPTTLLAQVDAAIGGKTGIDFGPAKNSIGSFYPAESVVVDTSALSSLSPAQLRQGAAEMLKIAAVRDERLFQALESGSAWSEIAHPDLIRRAIRNKVEIVAADPFEKTGERALLNFGHTIGHAVESVSAYSLAHGDCVAMGMVSEARIAQRLGFINAELVDRLQTALVQAGLPVQIPAYEVGGLLNALRNDKKRSGGTIRMIMLKGLGDAELLPVDEAVVAAALESGVAAAA